MRQNCSGNLSYTEVIGSRVGERSTKPVLLRLLKPHTWAAAVTVDELDAGRLEGGPDGKQSAGMGGAGASLEVDDGALRDLGAFGTGAHGGSLELESELGGDTTATIKYPSQADRRW